MRRQMATKADSCIPGNLIHTRANKAVRLIRTGMCGFPSGPEATMPHQQAGYMCATDPLLLHQFILAKRSGPYMCENDETGTNCRKSISSNAPQSICLDVGMIKAPLKLA
jgi:hypothetical protein